MAPAALAAKGGDKQLDALEKHVDDDLSTGALTQPDGDELKREIHRAERIADRNTTLTRATKRDIRQDVTKIQKDLERKEAQAKALAAAGAMPTP